MNDQSVIDENSAFTPRATQLLSEYTQKLASMLDRVKGLAARSADDALPDSVQVRNAEVRAVEQWFQRVSPAARRLAQQVSGMIDQGGISPLDKAELQLRLAEFETALLGFPQLLTVYWNQVNAPRNQPVSLAGARPVVNA